MKRVRPIVLFGILAVGVLASAGCKKAVRTGIGGGISDGLSGAFESFILTPAEQKIAEWFPSE